LLCPGKITEYLERGVPAGVVPRPPPADFPVAPIVPSAETEIEIIGLDRGPDRRLLVAFQADGRLQYLPLNELSKHFSVQLLAFLESLQ
jgi:hypothetical protein